MNIEIKLGVDRYRTCLAIAPDAYDGHPPVDHISYRLRIRVLDPNLCAVSAVIAMQDYASESLNLHAPVQVHVAEAIERFIEGRRFRVAPVAQVPAAIPSGRRRVLIGCTTAPTPSDTAFTLGGSESFTSYASVRAFQMSSNISCMLPNNEYGKLVSAIAATVFVAADYAFGEIVIGRSALDSIGEEEFARYRNLLNSVNIKLTAESAK